MSADAKPLPHIGRPFKYNRAKIADGVRRIHGGESPSAVAKDLGIKRDALLYHARGGKSAQYGPTCVAVSRLVWISADVELPDGDYKVMVIAEGELFPIHAFFYSMKWWRDTEDILRSKVIAWAHWPKNPLAKKP